MGLFPVGLSKCLALVLTASQASLTSSGPLPRGVPLPAYLLFLSRKVAGTGGGLPTSEKIRAKELLQLQCTHQCSWSHS